MSFITTNHMGGIGNVMFKLSVPRPPLILSSEVKVPETALNVSLPPVLVVPNEPTKAPESTPVVSGQVLGNAK